LSFNVGGKFDFQEVERQAQDLDKSVFVKEDKKMAMNVVVREKWLRNLMCGW